MTKTDIDPSVPKQLAAHLWQVHTGGNWTTVNLRGSVEGLTLNQALWSDGRFNSIAMLVFHTNYYVKALLDVLQGKPLISSDKFSFLLPPLADLEEWNALVAGAFADAEKAAELIEQLETDTLNTDFYGGKHGTWFRNITGVIEHTHYHIGQITLIRKILTAEGIE